MKSKYITIQEWMYDIGCDDLREIVAYAIIYGFSQDGESKFQGSISYVMRLLKCSKHTAINTLKSLEGRGLIKKEQVSLHGVVFNKYYAIAQDVQKLHYQCKNCTTSAKTSHNNNIDNNVSSNDDTVLESIEEKLLFNEEYISTKEINKESFEQKFDKFRRVYKGTKRGLRTEFDNFCKKHKDWKDVLEHIYDDYMRQEEVREANRAAGGFVPQPKNLQTYINNRCWEEEIQITTQTQNNYAIQSFDRELAKQRGQIAARAAALDACLDAAANSYYTEHGSAQGY